MVGDKAISNAVVMRINIEIDVYIARLKLQARAIQGDGRMFVIERGGLPSLPAETGCLSVCLPLTWNQNWGSSSRQSGYRQSHHICLELEALGPLQIYITDLTFESRHQCLGYIRHCAQQRARIMIPRFAQEKASTLDLRYKATNTHMQVQNMFQICLYLACRVRLKIVT